MSGCGELSVTDRTVTYEIQHIFPREVLSGTSVETQAVQELLINLPESKEQDLRTCNGSVQDA